jgi:hypothetical protein
MEETNIIITKAKMKAHLFAVSCHLFPPLQTHSQSGLVTLFSLFPSLILIIDMTVKVMQCNNNNSHSL